MAKRRALSEEEAAAQQRLRTLWDQRQAEWRERGQRLTQAIAADHFGWSEQSAVSQYLNGRLALNLDAIFKFASLLEVEPTDIWPDLGRFGGFQLARSRHETSEDTPAAVKPPAHTVRVPYYPDVPAAAGHGCVPLDEANVTVLEIARSLLERCGVSPSDAALLQADGDSMRGVIEHGDLMVINTAEQDVREGRVFVVSVDGELLVKRIQRIPRGIKLVSENPIYEPITIMEDDQDTNVRLIGRVALAWSMTGFM